MTALTPEQEKLWPQAKAAYERYSEASAGRSQVTGDKLPPWENLPNGIKNAWWAVADELRADYPQIRKLFDMISADNSGCTADEIEALLATLSDEQLLIIAAGEQTEMDELKEQLQREGPPGVADALWNMAAVAFDG